MQHGRVMGFRWTNGAPKRPLAILCLMIALVAGSEVASAEDALESALDKIFKSEAGQQLVIEHLEFEASDPLLSQEMRDAEQELAAIVKDLPRPPASPDAIALDLAGDTLLGAGDRLRTLVLFLNPACEHCLRVLRLVVEKNDFDARNVVVKWTPDIGLADFWVSMYMTCNVTDVKTLLERMQITQRLLAEHPDDADADETDDMVEHARTSFDLYFDDMKACRTFDRARHLLQNVIELQRQCERLGCEKGYWQVSMNGLISLGYAPSTPAWFLGFVTEPQGGKGLLRIESAGIGIESLSRAIGVTAP